MFARRKNRRREISKASKAINTKTMSRFPNTFPNDAASTAASSSAYHFRGPLEALFSLPALGICFLMIFLLFSAMSVVVSKHLDRSLHIRLQQLQKTRDDLHVEWSRLLLEQGTLGADPRVELIAREELGMKVPAVTQIQVMRP